MGPVGEVTAELLLLKFVGAKML
jgi:hypothetical protein